jgi:hypothetical protein
MPLFPLYPPKADRWILPQAKSNVLIRHGNCFRSNLKGMDAGGNRFPRFLRSKNLKAKNGKDAVFRPRKG